ncbi:hypothetical protein [Nonomuraea turcica]|uniref:hypothetical protein n=1 Tax=Nonomuraea sp. G32 TaxID=3067274 RepID=UPI00273B8E79|nr:hypothetical protein [Nonomuraea sp. G32]MDP4511954.1 hypothetical protein [Nonomuraea sp. G32]
MSTGFVAKVNAQLAARLAGFEDEVKKRLRRAEVARDGRDAGLAIGQDGLNHGMHDGKVVWCGAGLTRGPETIKGFDLLTAFTGILVGDDCVGHLFLDSLLAGVQICLQRHP